MGNSYGRNISLAIVLLSIGIASAGGAPAEKAQSVPQFGFANYAWSKVSDDFQAPQSGPGPVMSDKSHPYVANGVAERSGRPITLRIADLEQSDFEAMGARPDAEGERTRGGWQAGLRSARKLPPRRSTGFMVMGRVNPMYIVQSPKEVVFMNEGGPEVRRVYLDVPHTAHPRITPYGESIGHYEGDTLVVDTIALSPETFIDNYRTPHTDQEHVIETIQTLPTTGKCCRWTSTLRIRALSTWRGRPARPTAKDSRSNLLERGASGSNLRRKQRSAAGRDGDAHSKGYEAGFLNQQRLRADRSLRMARGRMMVSVSRIAPNIIGAAALLAVVATAVPVNAAAIEGIWSVAAQMTAARTEIGAVALNGKDLCRRWSGDGTPRFRRCSRCSIRQPASWKDLAPMPKGASHIGMTVLDGKIYVAGGFTVRPHVNPIDQFAVYDPAANKWQSLAPLSVKLGSVSLAAVQGKIHALGGRMAGEVTVNMHAVYDPNTQKWSTAAPLPGPRDHMGVVAVNGRIHLIAGRNNDNPSDTAVQDVYDPATDKWARVASLPLARSGGMAVFYRGQILYYGGECRTMPTRGAYDLVDFLRSEDRSLDGTADAAGAAACAGRRRCRRHGVCPGWFHQLRQRQAITRSVLVPSKL